MRDPLPAVLERAHRVEYGQILATLLGWLGDFELAEDAVQDAFLAALERWERDGTPDNPGAWLTTTARRKAVDRLRKNLRARSIPQSWTAWLPPRPNPRRPGAWTPRAGTAGRIFPTTASS